MRSPTDAAAGRASKAHRKSSVKTTRNTAGLPHENIIMAPAAAASNSS